jgi:hypothetical protein
MTDVVRDHEVAVVDERRASPVAVKRSHVDRGRRIWRRASAISRRSSSPWPVKTTAAPWARDLVGDAGETGGSQLERHAIEVHPIPRWMATTGK